jgi:microcin C transport system substrate-binding protein
VNPKIGVLEKKGRRFRFKFLTRSASTEKFLNIYAQDLKDVGIELRIDRKDWASWTKDMDEFNFDITWAAWGGGLFKNPEGMWASKEATRKSGNNITGFKNKTVDAMIDKQRNIFDINKRHAICRKIDGILTQHCPYILLWRINYVRLLYWNKFGTPETVLSKHGDESSSYWYWWYDEDSAQDLTSAMKNKKRLPSRKYSVFFDKEFRK